MHKSEISNKHSKNNLRDKNTNIQLLQKRQIQNTKNNKWNQIQNNYKIKGRSKTNRMAISNHSFNVELDINLEI